MFTKATADMFFATPVARYHVEDCAPLNDDLLALGQKMRAESDGLSLSNRGGFHSPGNVFLQDAPCIAQLSKTCLSATMRLTQTIKAGVDLDTLEVGITGWMNINGRGAYNAPHTHPGNLWSGVYYVKQPKVEEGDSGMIEFLDPRSDLPQWRLLQAPAFQPKRRFRPVAGEIVIFPSYLMHWVYPNDTDEERVTIAFNVSLRPKPAS